MTTVGHSLMGISIGLLVLPIRLTLFQKLMVLAFFVGLANIPDFPLPYWGHDLYFFSHSIFVNAVLMILAWIVLWMWKSFREKWGGWKVVVCGWLAWMSHFLLDSFYNHNLGIRIFWPFSDGRLNLALPWFRTLSPEFSSENFRIFLVEFAFYGALLVICFGIRMVLIRQIPRAYD